MRGNHQKENVAGNGARTEQALRASELSYRRLFEAAKDGILILDVDTGRINDVNPFFSKLLGFSRSEILGRTVGELSPFKDIESNQAMLERLQKDGYVRYEDLPLETRDGRKITVEFVSNVYQAGDCNVIQCNVRDITDKNRGGQNFGDGSMIIKPSIFQNPNRATWAYTLVEVLMSVGILAIMMVSLYAAFISGFTSIKTTREELRATQILTQKLEAIRLCTWAQLSNCPTSFREYYDPLGITNSSTGGAIYAGTFSTTDVATNIPDSLSYKPSLHLITVTVTWTNYINNNRPIIHTRQMQTLSAYNGLQNYIWGMAP
jgi:PAS domain S-box-containing protein